MATNDGSREFGARHIFGQSASSSSSKRRMDPGTISAASERDNARSRELSRGVSSKWQR